MKARGGKRLSALFGSDSMCAPRCCAQAYGIRKEFFSHFPSAYPFSAQARFGPRWANLFSRLRRFLLVAMTVSLALCDSRIVPLICVLGQVI
jgi:hypothetical protein